ncbi:hypothetical protein RE432_17645 [Pusillimonas sp. SM2304]|uniref:hypothetical protein n=1 Tax=Pusillimonas sp. SM2304 TaxID=3073241 RepID=UPI0028764F19|nr:hypothetical protein [Pusillimonas sp. SM2304]MDS1142263.1 hypothetical protein [Pusillimonas sp. SM2304]
MNAYSTVAIPLLCCGVTFLLIGMVMGNVTFLSLGAAFLATGLPFLIVGVNRKRAATGGK